jgi:hypothetical protein
MYTSTQLGHKAGYSQRGSQLAGGVAAGLMPDIIQREDKHPAVSSGGGSRRYSSYRTPHSRLKQLAGGLPGDDASEWMATGTG